MSLVVRLSLLWSILMGFLSLLLLLPNVRITVTHGLVFVNIVIDILLVMMVVMLLLLVVGNLVLMVLLLRLPLLVLWI